MDGTDSRPYSQWLLRIVILGVACNGLLFIAGTLASEFLSRNRFHSSDAAVGLQLIIGLTLIYLSSLLARRKRAAWAIALPVYGFILGFSVLRLAMDFSAHHSGAGGLVRGIVLPLVIVTGLAYYHGEFVVKSDLENFRQSLRFIIIVLLVAFAYGVIGFQLMDTHDFHREISLLEAMHRTIDQFGLTTNNNLVPYTRRAKIFVDSLSVISVGALAYTLVSLFQPLRARFHDQEMARERLRELLERYPAGSEDFFKLWPHDKAYFFNGSRTSGVALHVHHGVALMVGDPAGTPETFGALLHDIDSLCYGNDWRPAFIHTDPKHSRLYERHGLSLQKIGEEAILDIKHFQTEVAGNKYFRHIRNKFTKQDFITELLQPPHHAAVIDRLRVVSDEWLAQPGRAERGVMMGYFSDAYLQQCPIMVVRDGAGTIQAFMNQIPSFDTQEANFDLLRQSAGSPGNINDFLLMSFIDHADREGFVRLNLGLCPLAGLDDKQENASVIDGALRFVYANGDRFYSFTGLQRFKAKYEPEWSDRFVAYRGGIRGFTRVLNALNQAMKVKSK